MSVDTVKFLYEGHVIYNNTQYIITAKQKDTRSKVKVTIEKFDDVKSRSEKEFDHVFDFFEWLYSK